MSDSECRHPWEMPDCPDCGGHLFVERSRKPDSDMHCLRCDVHFDGELVDRDVTGEVVA